MRALAALLPIACLACAADAPPNVLLVSIDTLRPDHLEAYGYGRATSPTLRALANQGVLYERAYAPSPSTVPSHATLFTGRLPSQHRTFHSRNRLPDAEQTLAELLGAAGWRSFAVTSSVRFHEVQGFAQGFESFERVHELPKNELGAAVSDRAIAQLSLDDSRPFFAFLHYLGPHEPYAAPEPFRSRWHPGLDEPVPEETSRFLQRRRASGPPPSEEELDYLRALYDAEILYLDAELARLMEALDATGQGRRTLVIVTSDHGEEFGEHGGLSHGHALHEELLRVPLVLRWPGHLPAGARPPASAELADLLPTVLELVGLPPPPEIVGRSLVADWAGRGESPADDLVIGQLGERQLSVAMRLPAGRFKLLLKGGREQLFRLDDDPLGTRPLEGGHRDERARLRRLAEGVRALPRRNASEEIEVSPQIRALLEEIGYLDEFEVEGAE